MAANTNPLPEAPETARPKRADLAARAAAQPRTPDGRFGPAHGGYALAARIEGGRLDLRRREDREFVAYRDRLVRDLRGDEEERGDWPPAGLSAQEQALVEEAAFKRAVVDALKVYALRSGVVKRNGRLAPVLAEHYITWAESLRRDLVSLGLQRRARAKGLREYLQERYGAKEGSA